MSDVPDPIARDHGGGLDAAVTRFGGKRFDWLDLSTGINPVPYPIPETSMSAWTDLPDAAAVRRLEIAARRFWKVPQAAGLIAAGGASALIARIPTLADPGRVRIPGPTYNEHAAAFRAAGWQLTEKAGADAQVIVHPNNPDGRLWTTASLPASEAQLTVIDESFCDVCPEHSLIARATQPGTLVLKSFGKFWGLAGLRLGFAIGDQALIAALREALGPWPVAGPALEIGTAALMDEAWADVTRQRLTADTARLDALIRAAGAELVGGTMLFRLYRVLRAEDWQTRLARHRIWSRIFPYDPTWLRLGLPPPDGWSRLEDALAG
jgi:cobalamin biosynthetic protein CobC